MGKAIAILTVLLAWFVAGSAGAADIEKIRIGTEGAYPPFNFVDSKGRLRGFDIDIANALCEAAGAECVFVKQEWEGLIPGLKAKKYDAVVASMTITEQRKKQVDFTKKYYHTPARFVARKGSGIELSKEGLEGKNVGVQRATVSDYFVRDKFGDAVGVKSYGTQEEANMDLTSGRLDLVFAESAVLLAGFLNTEAGGDYEFVGPEYTDEKYFGEGIGIAVRKGDDELLKTLNEAIDEIRSDGTYRKINDKYFDFDVYGEK